MDNFTENLILAVKERPILYDKNHIDNKNYFKKAVAWEEVSNEIGGRDGETAKEKWKNLRDTYKKYKKTQLPNPNGPMAVQKLKNWVWAPQMEFVDKLISMNSNRCSRSYRNSCIQPTGSDKRIDAKTSLGSLDNEQHNIMELRHGLSAPRSAGTTPQDNKVNRSNKRRILEKPDETADYKTPKQEQHSDELDKIDYLFLHYAETFKTFTPRRQALVKLELAKMFSEAELQNMDEMEQIGCESSIKIENVMQYYPNIDSSSNSD